MRLLSWTIGLLIVVVLAVLFVPGLGPSIEARLLGWMAGLAG
ncbi:MAG: hypothetical protein OXH69_10240 [Acidobacteria bacterium]|nr:hypothetical protein [Acidobacteriota bacterium]